MVKVKVSFLYSKELLSVRGSVILNKNRVIVIAPSIFTEKKIKNKISKNLNKDFRKTIPIPNKFRKIFENLTRQIV